MGNVGKGVLGGAMSGAGAGASIAGPYGALVGAIIGGVGGYAAGTGADKKAKQAQAAADAIPMIDPMDAAHLMRTKQLARTQRAGADQTSAYGMANTYNVLGQTGANITRASAGNPTQALSGLLMAQNQAGQSIQGIGANAGARADQLLQYEGGLIGNATQRRRDLMEFKRNQLYSELVGQQQNINNTFSAGLGVAPQLGFMPNFRRASMPAPMREADNMGSMGTRWHTEGTGNPTPSPTVVPQYQMIADPAQNQPTSEYDMGQQVFL